MENLIMSRKCNYWSGFLSWTKYVSKHKGVIYMYLSKLFHVQKVYLYIQPICCRVLVWPLKTLTSRAEIPNCTLAWWPVQWPSNDDDDDDDDDDDNKTSHLKMMVATMMQEGWGWKGGRWWRWQRVTFNPFTTSIFERIVKPGGGGLHILPP